MHPDPLGQKVEALRRLVATAVEVQRPPGRTLLFFDFLSVTQLPRTAEDEAAFQQALQEMPRLYVDADAVLHLDIALDEVPPGGDTFRLNRSDLADAAFRDGRDGRVQLVGGRPKTELFASVLSIGDVDVVSVAQLEAALASQGATDADGVEVVLQRPYLGEPNRTLTGERGWVFLERFCSMVKTALVDPSEVERVAFSTRSEVLQQIHKGGERLRAAAQQGEEELERVLQHMTAELSSKHFSAGRPDAAKMGSIHRRASAGHPSLEGDAAIVAGLMKTLAQELPSHWSQRERDQRQRQLILAANRGDAQSARGLLQAGADPDAADPKTGERPLHRAAAQQFTDVVRVLLEFGADPAGVDALGNTPLHMVSMLSNPTTIELYRLLGSSAAVLQAPNDAGATPARKFELFATSKSDNAYPPALELLEELRRTFPELNGGDSFASAELSAELSAMSVRRLHRTVEVVAGSDRARVRFEVWQPEALRAGEVALHVVWVNGTLPFSLAHHALDTAGCELCVKLGAELLVLNLLAGELPLRSEPAEAAADICKAIDALGLSAPTVVVEDALSFLGLAWRLARRPAGLLFVNPGYFFEEEFLQSHGYQNVLGMCRNYAEAFQACSRDAIAAAYANQWLSKESILETLESDPTTAHTLQYWAMYFRWIIDDKLSSLANSLPALTPPVPPAAIALSAFSGTMSVHKPSARLASRWLPGARLEYIQDSWTWIGVEGPAVRAALRRVLIEVCAEACSRGRWPPGERPMTVQPDRQ